MDSSLWSKLPEDLQGRILACLPLESLAQVQLVCQNWKSRLQNRHFLRERSEAGASSNSWFIFPVKQEPPLSSSFTVDCYNTHSNKWHELKLGHLPPIQEVCAASGSLLLCVGGIVTAKTYEVSSMVDDYWPGSACNFSHMMVCNPLKSNSWEKIDLPLEIRRCSKTHIGMVADKRSENYKIMIQKSSPSDLQVYDSRQKSWKSFETTWWHLHDIDSAPVAYRGKMLFLGAGGLAPGKMFIYNLEHNTRNCFDISFARNHPGDMEVRRYLANCGGRLLMVKFNIAISEPIFEVQVFEYLHKEDDLSDGVWHDLTFMPADELERLMSLNSKDAADFLAGARASSSKPSSSRVSLPSSRNDLLCITMGIQMGLRRERLNSSLSYHTKGRAIFLYSLSQNLWCCVGKRPHYCSTTRWSSRSLAFQPSFRSVS